MLITVGYISIFLIKINYKLHIRFAILVNPYLIFIIM